MRDKILESIFLDTTLWADCIAHGVDKHIAHNYLEKLADPHVRAELCVKIAEGRYKIKPPHTGYRKKDDGGERMFLANEPMDRLILNIIYKWLMKNESARIHHSCKSYQSGIGVGNIVKQIANRISKCPTQHSGNIIGRKFDIHKYFETIEREYIHNSLSVVEKDFGKSSIIDLLRDYYDTDIYYDTRKHEYVNRYQGIKQGCAVSSWLANVLLYTLDDELSHRGGLYVRYSDDILYIGDDYNEVTTIIRERLSQIGLKLNEQKVSDISAEDYFKFLGYEIHGSDLTLSRKWVKSFEHEINKRTIHNVPLIQKVRRIRKENGNNCEKQLNNILAKTTRNVERFVLYGDGKYSWATEVLTTVNNTRDLLQLTTYCLDALRAVYTGHTHIGGLGKSLKHGIQRGKGRNVKSNRLATQHLEIHNGGESYLEHFISLFASQKTISNKWLFRTLSVNMVNTHKYKTYGQTDPINMQDIPREEMITQLEMLYETYLYSQPNGNSLERFYAYSIDDISLDQLIEGTNRDEALLLLEQYLVEKVNFSKLQETPGDWYWQSKKFPQLVLLEEWFNKYNITTATPVKQQVNRQSKIIDMNIEDLKSAAKSGDIDSQYQLGQCYLEGSNGLRKNRKYYETWLDKAATNGHQRAAEELSKYYGNKSIKTTYSPTLQLKYLKLTGKDISEEQLINLGDPISCKTKAESLLFEDNTHVDFEKAKLCLLKSHLDSDTLKCWADKYLALHCNDSLEVDNIVYLYLLAANQDMNLLNDYISSLYDSEFQSPIRKMIIYRLLNREKGTTQMIMSRIYCLMEGFGTKKNTRMAAKLYLNLSKEEQENLTAFQSTHSSGIHFSMPKSEVVEKERSKFNKNKRKKNLHNFVSNNLLTIIFFPITIPYKAIFYLIPKGLLPKEIKIIGLMCLIASLYTGYKAFNNTPHMTLCTVLLILLGIMVYFSSYKGGKTCPKCRKHNSMSEYKKISEGGMQYHCVRTCSKCGYKETSDSFYDDGDGCR